MDFTPGMGLLGGVKVDYRKLFDLPRNEEV